MPAGVARAVRQALGPGRTPTGAAGRGLTKQGTSRQRARRTSRLQRAGLGGHVGAVAAAIKEHAVAPLVGLRTALKGTFHKLDDARGEARKAFAGAIARAIAGALSGALLGSISEPFWSLFRSPFGVHFGAMLEPF